MRDNEFRSALDESLELIRRGGSIEDCLKAYPQHADRLTPFLRSAMTLRGLGVPAPSSAGMQQARNTLLERVVEGKGKEAAIVKGLFKFAHVAGVAVAALFVAGMSFVAAAGPGGLFGGSDSNHVEFRATVVSMAPTLFYVQNNDNGQYVFLVLSNQTQYQDNNGHAIARTDIHVRDQISVRAGPSINGPRFLDAFMIRLGHAPTEPTVAPTDKPEPTAEPTKAPDPTPVVTEKPAPEPTKAPTPKPTDKPVAQEWWGTVLTIAETYMTIKNGEGMTVTVFTTADTQFPTGYPFVGVKVWVLATKNADGSWTAQKITVKMTEFMGTVTGIEGDTFFVNSNGSNMAVHTDAQTTFPNGVPVVGDTVGVGAFKMGDGSYLAKTIIIKVIPISFTGVIIEHDPVGFKIIVDVGGVHKLVCYQFADVIGTLAVGATVMVQVEHIEGDWFFAGLVKVVG